MSTRGSYTHGKMLAGGKKMLRVVIHYNLITLSLPLSLPFSPPSQNPDERPSFATLFSSLQQMVARDDEYSETVD